MYPAAGGLYIGSGAGGGGAQYAQGWYCAGGRWCCPCGTCCCCCCLLRPRRRLERPPWLPLPWPVGAPPWLRPGGAGPPAGGRHAVLVEPVAARRARGGRGAAGGRAGVAGEVVEFNFLEEQQGSRL